MKTTELHRTGRTRQSSETHQSGRSAEARLPRPARLPNAEANVPNTECRGQICRGRSVVTCMPLWRCIQRSPACCRQLARGMSAAAEVRELCTSCGVGHGAYRYVSSLAGGQGEPNGLQGSGSKQYGRTGRTTHRHLHLKLHLRLHTSTVCRVPIAECWQAYPCGDRRRYSTASRRRSFFQNRML